MSNQKKKKKIPFGFLVVQYTIFKQKDEKTENVRKKNSIKLKEKKKQKFYSISRNENEKN